MQVHDQELKAELQTELSLGDALVFILINKGTLTTTDNLTLCLLSSCTPLSSFPFFFLSLKHTSQAAEHNAF